jgi:hypothetical protein
MIFMPPTLWGIFYYVNLIEFWGERVTGDGDRGGEEEAVEKCKGAKVITSGPVGEWTGGRGRGERQCKGGKVERWEGRIRGLVVGWTGGRGNEEARGSGMWGRGLFGYEGAVGGLAPEAVNVDDVFANSCDGNFQESLTLGGFKKNALFLRKPMSYATIANL